MAIVKMRLQDYTICPPVASQPKSLQKADLISLLENGSGSLSVFLINLFILAKAPAKEESKISPEIISRVFANPISLGISFRKNPLISEDFLKSNSGSEIDYEAIDILANLCKDGPLQKALIQGIVRKYFIS